MEEHTPQANLDEPTSQGSLRVLALIFAPIVLALIVIGAWIGTHWYMDESDEWGGLAKRAYRTSRTLAVSQEDWGIRAEYANQLMALELASPPIIRDYLTFRVNGHCRRTVELAPPGAAERCAYPELERAWRRKEGAALMELAQRILPNAESSYRAAVHRYVARGASLSGDWPTATEHFEATFTERGGPGDALSAGWAAIKSGKAEEGLRLLAEAEKANDGYPGRPYRQANMLPMRPRERAAALSAYKVRAEFFHALRASGMAMMQGEDAIIPEWPGGVYG